MDKEDLIVKAIDELKKEFKSEIAEFKKEIKGIKDTIFICITCVLNNPTNQEAIRQIIASWQAGNTTKKTTKEKIIGLIFDIIKAGLFFGAGWLISHLKP